MEGRRESMVHPKMEGLPFSADQSRRTIRLDRPSQSHRFSIAMVVGCCPASPWCGDRASGASLTPVRISGDLLGLCMISHASEFMVSQPRCLAFCSTARLAVARRHGARGPTETVATSSRLSILSNKDRSFRQMAGSAPPYSGRESSAGFWSVKINCLDM